MRSRATPIRSRGATNPFAEHLLESWSSKPSGETEEDQQAFERRLLRWAPRRSRPPMKKAGSSRSRRAAGGTPRRIAGRTGIGMSQRMQSFVLDERINPYNVLEPEKAAARDADAEPRAQGRQALLCPSPSRVATRQDQNLLQFFLNVVEFDMNVQQAVEAANFNSYPDAELVRRASSRSPAGSWSCTTRCRRGCGRSCAAWGTSSSSVRGPRGRSTRSSSIGSTARCGEARATTGRTTALRGKRTLASHDRFGGRRRLGCHGPGRVWHPCLSKLVVDARVARDPRRREHAQIDATVYDADGNVLDVRGLVSCRSTASSGTSSTAPGASTSSEVRPDGLVAASRPGDYAVMIRVPKDENATRPRRRGVPAAGDSAHHPSRRPRARLELSENVPERLLRRHDRLDARRAVPSTPPTAAVARTDPVSVVETDARYVAAVSDRTGIVDPHGSRSHHDHVTESADEASESSRARGSSRAPSPSHLLRATCRPRRARPGDVVRLRGHRLKDASGSRRRRRARHATASSAATDPLASGGPELRAHLARTVASSPTCRAASTIVCSATAGGSERDGRSISSGFPVTSRSEVELVGHARVSDRATSDLWVWEGPDGRDYAITGTHSRVGSRLHLGRHRARVEHADDRHGPRRRADGQRRKDLRGRSHRGHQP